MPNTDGFEELLELFASERAVPILVERGELLCHDLGGDDLAPAERPAESHCEVETSHETTSTYTTPRDCVQV
jgi:hypothetical protein